MNALGNLEGDVRAWKVQTNPIRTVRRTISIQSDGLYSGGSTSGEWEQRDFDLRSPAEGDEYDALIEALETECPPSL